MKRIICTVLLLSLLVCSFTSCTKTTEEEDGRRLNVLTTVFPPYDFAKAVGGELIDVQMLMAPETDSHSYSGDNPSDILKIASCDLFIYIGGESESKWVDDVLSSIEKSGIASPRILNLSQYCNLLEETDNGIIQKETHTHEHHDHSEGEHHECSFDEHIWTSLINAEIMTNKIAEALAQLDGENAEVYIENALSYSAELRELDRAFSDFFESCDNKTLIFADRFPFAYFEADYSLNHYAAFSGCSSEAEVSPTTLAAIADIMEQKGIKDVFYIETSKSDVPELLCRILDAEMHLLHSCHTVSERQLDEGVTYISLMENNLDTLRKALSND